MMAAISVLRLIAASAGPGFPVLVRHRERLSVFAGHA
jgi:hypothetical protein